MTDFVYPYTYAPLLQRHLKGKIHLTLPIHRGEGRTIRPWLRDALGPGVPLTFNEATSGWEVGRGHLAAARDAIVERYGMCYVDTEAKLSTTRQCDERCQEAAGPDCSCTCGGEFHGDLDTTHNWVRVGETTLVSSTSTTRVHRRWYVRADVAPRYQNRTETVAAGATTTASDSEPSR